MASSSFGWDLLYQTVKDDIKNDIDVLICFTHLILISNGFKCVGLGDSKVLDGTENKSEVLPKGWNEAYAVRYVFQGRLYNLKATNMDDAVMINLIRVDERSVSMVQLNANAVAQRTGSLDQMIPNSDELAQNIKKQLIDKVTVSNKHHESTTQTDPQPSRSTPNIGTPLPPFPLHFPTGPSFGGVGVGGVGSSDLDPLGGLPRFPRVGGVGTGMGGGGMIFTPPRIPPLLDPLGPNAGVAPGSIPPGARFDPFRAPDPDAGQSRGRRNFGDDMPPPGYDDMFM